MNSDGPDPQMRADVTPMRDEQFDRLLETRDEPGPMPTLADAAARARRLTPSDDQRGGGPA